MCDTSSVALAGLADQLGWPGLLRAVVDGLVGLQTDELTEDELAGTMRVVQTEQTRLGNLQALLFDARRRRVIARGRQSSDGREDANAGVRAARQLEQDVAGELGIGNGEAKRIAKAGRAIARDPDAARAAKQGRVSAEHLRVLDDKLRDVGDLGLQVRLRRELLAKAAGLDLYGFRRACDRAIAQADQAAAARAEDRRQSRRSAKTFETDDGMLGLSARFSGIDAETVATAIDAYRTPDGAGQRRRPEQRTADALVDMATVALRHIDSTSHGHPPQILVVVDRTNLTRLTEAGHTTLGVSDTVAGAVTDAAGTTFRHTLRDAVTGGHTGRHDAAGGRHGRSGPVRDGHGPVRDRHHVGPAGGQMGDGTHATGVSRAGSGSHATGGTSAASSITATGAGGVVESVWLGALPASELSLIQAQALVTLIVRGGHRPTLVTTHTRAVPSGLWPLLVARDRGCVADGCDVPAGWCDIVHLHIDYHPGGRLSEANAALVCRRHHRAYDHPTRPLVAIWHDHRPTLIRRSQVPDRARRTPPDHLIPESGLQGPVPGRAVPVIDPATRQPTGRWLPAAPTREDGSDIAAADATGASTGRTTSRGTATDTGDRGAVIAGALAGAITTAEADTSATANTTGGRLAPAGETPATDTTGGATHGSTVGAAARTTPVMTSDATLGRRGTVTDRRSHADHDSDPTGAGDHDGYARHRTTDQPSLLAEPHVTYQAGAGPPTARPRGPTDRSSRGPTDPRPRGPTPGRDRQGTRHRDRPATDPRPEERAASAHAAVRSPAVPGT